MKSIILITLALVAVTVALPVDNKVPETVEEFFEQKPDGSYIRRFKTDNGISQEEQGERKTVVDEENKPHDVIIVKGSSTYTDPEGKVQTITYVGDENGYQAKGDAIPVAPQVN